MNKARTRDATTTQLAMISDKLNSDTLDALNAQYSPTKNFDVKSKNSRHEILYSSVGVDNQRRGHSTFS